VFLFLTRSEFAGRSTEKNTLLGMKSEEGTSVMPDLLFQKNLPDIQGANWTSLMSNLPIDMSSEELSLV